MIQHTSKPNGVKSKNRRDPRGLSNLSGAGLRSDVFFLAYSFLVIRGGTFSSQCYGFWFICTYLSRHDILTIVYIRVLVSSLHYARCCVPSRARLQAELQ